MSPRIPPPSPGTPSRSAPISGPRRGFSVLEILIAVTILAVTAGIFTLIGSQARQQKLLRTRIAALSALKQEMELRQNAAYADALTSECLIQRDRRYEDATVALSASVQSLADFGVSELSVPLFMEKDGNVEVRRYPFRFKPRDVAVIELTARIDASPRAVEESVVFLRCNSGWGGTGDGGK